MSRRLGVWLHGRKVGLLREAPDGGTSFRFLAAYRDLVPRPVLGQKLEDDLDRTHSNRAGEGLPDFFANLIPEGRLREVIETTAGLEAGDDLGLLAFVGEDLPGAVSVRTEGGEEDERRADEAPTPGGDSRRSSDTEAEGLRFSLAGVQLKLSMLRDGDRLTLPARHRGGEWIVKFDSPTFHHLPENEHAMLEWVRAAGFEVPICHLHAVDAVEGFPRRYALDGTRVLAIARYDRGGDGRIHQEDFAQAVGLPPSRKYDQITHEAMARLVRRFIDDQAVDELVRRLALVIATGNNDAHLKNWSLIYPDAIQARWAPLYDQVATVAWSQPDRALALKLAGVKAFGRIDRATFERFAERSEGDPRRVLAELDSTLERLRDSWRAHAGSWLLPASHRQALVEHWRQVPLLRDAGPLD